jgi:hypothetical protein
VNNKFDELAKGLAQSLTRRQALRRFGFGLAGMALACFGLANKSWAGNKACQSNYDCSGSQQCCRGLCISVLDNNNCGACDYVCPMGTTCKPLNVNSKDFGHGHGVICA